MRCKPREWRYIGTHVGTHVGTHIGTHMGTYIAMQAKRATNTYKRDLLTHTKETY